MSKNPSFERNARNIKDVTVMKTYELMSLELDELFYIALHACNRKGI